MTRSRGSKARVAHAMPDFATEACTSISLLMLRWQATGSVIVFERVVEHVRPHVERVAERVLRQRGLRDPDAVEDTVTLVLDHLRRLAGSQGRERSVARFVPAWSGAHGGAASDPGLRFITCLTTDRARDVVRARRRQRSVPFSQLGTGAASAVERRLAASVTSAGSGALIDRIRAAATRLEPRQRLLVDLLLEGKSQAVIAHVLGVCEGTVSRLRCRTIAMLQTLMAE